MQLILNTPGTLLRIKDGNIFVMAGERKMEIAPRKLHSILVTTGVRFSSDVIRLALEWNIDIVFLNRFGDPYGRLWHCRLGSTTAIRRRQLQVTETAEGVRIVLALIDAKFSAQLTHLQDLRKRRTRNTAPLTRGIEKLTKYREELNGIRADNVSVVRDRILGVEGSAGRVYFQILAAVLPEKYRFDGRSRNPARDYFNCLLNYAYGVLYSLVERGCILAGLDPYTGILHTDNYNKTSMVFDLIEPYRVWADATVMLLLSGRKIKKEYFDRVKEGYSLNQEGKPVLMARYNKYLEEAVRYRGRNIKRRDIIQFDCHRLANKLIRKNLPERVPQPFQF